MRPTPFSLEVKRSIPATPQQVFDAWTIPSELAAWWAPPGGSCGDVAIDLRPGGKYSIENEMPNGIIFVIHGEYLAIDPPNLLQFTWVGGDGQADEIVTVTFDQQGASTQVAVAHARVASEEAVESHSTGWRSCLDGLASHWT